MSNQDNSAMSGELVESLIETVAKVDRGTPYFMNPEGKQEVAPGITRIDYDRHILRSE